MGGRSYFARCVWKIPILTLVAGGLLCGSVQDAAFQDIAAHPDAVMQNGVRWTASIPGADRMSEFSPTFRFADAGPVSGGLLSAADEPATTGSITDSSFDATIQRVNRAKKGDLLTSRPPQALIERKIPTSGTVWTLEDIFSSYDEGDELPKVAFAPAAQMSAKTIMLAYNGFLKPERLERQSNILLAKAEPVQGPDLPAGPDEIAANATLVAYAPALSDANAPFSELLDNPTSLGSAGSPVPRTRPDSIELARFMTGHGPQRRRPGDHSWAANTLPPHVYKAAQQDCLARGIYFEARGEPVRGQAAVGQVILNRVKNPAYPDTICGVVYQNMKWRNRCQFSFACDGIRDRVHSSKLYNTAQFVAREVTEGNIWLPEVGDATHYHATYVRPRWARKLKKTDKIGRHIFYRTKNGGWS